MKKSLAEFDLAKKIISVVTQKTVDIMAVSVTKKKITVFFSKEFPPIQFRLMEEKWKWFWYTGNGDIDVQSTEDIAILLKGAYE